MFTGNLGDARESVIDKRQWSRSQSNLPSIGCKQCLNKEKENIYSRRQMVNHQEKRREEKGGNIAHKGSLEINLSNLCNFDCMMCVPRFSSKWEKISNDLADTPNKPAPKTTPSERREVVKKIKDSLHEYSMLSVLGGEPFADPNVLEILSHIGKLREQPHVRVTTNASLINAPIIEILQKIKGLSIGVSVDGVNEYYEFIRGFSFDQLINNISLLRKSLLNLDLSIAFTTTSLNILHLPEFISYFKKFHEDMFFSEVSFRQVLEGNETPFSISYLKPEEVKYVIEHIEPKIKSKKIPNRFNNIPDIFRYIRLQLNSDAPSPEKLNRRQSFFTHFEKKRYGNPHLKRLKNKKFPLFINESTSSHVMPKLSI